MLRQPGWFNLLQCLQADRGLGRFPEHIFPSPLLHTMNTVETPRKFKNIYIKTAIKIKISRFPCNEWPSRSYTGLDRSRCQVLRQETAYSSQPLSLPCPQHLGVWKFLWIACQGSQGCGYCAEPGAARGQEGCQTRMPCLIPPSSLCFSPPTS